MKIMQKTSKTLLASSPKKYLSSPYMKYNKAVTRWLLSWLLASTVNKWDPVFKQEYLPQTWYTPILCFDCLSNTIACKVNNFFSWLLWNKYFFLSFCIGFKTTSVLLSEISYSFSFDLYSISFSLTSANLKEIWNTVKVWRHFAKKEGSHSGPLRSCSAQRSS